MDEYSSPSPDDVAYLVGCRTLRNMYAAEELPASRSGTRPVSTAETCERTLDHMATPFLIVLVEVAVIAAVLYLAVRFGVRDGMTDFENRKARRGP